MPRSTRANNKTQPHEGDVLDFLHGVEPSGRREDAFVLLDLMAEVNAEPARMSGSGIVGFGAYQFSYDSGRQGGHMLTGFAPRKANMVVYIMPGIGQYGGLLGKLGKYRTGQSCLYLGRLNGVDIKVLRKLVDRAVKDMRRKYGW